MWLLVERGLVKRLLIWELLVRELSKSVFVSMIVWEMISDEIVQLFLYEINKKIISILKKLKQTGALGKK